MVLDLRILKKIQIIEKVIELQLDVILFSLPDYKWNEYTKVSIQNIIKEVHHKIEMISTDSRDYSYTRFSYLPGGTLSIW